MALSLSLVRSALTKEGVISEERFDQLAEECAARHEDITSALVRTGIVNESRLYGLLARTLKIPYIDLASYSFNQDILDLIPAQTARQFRLIPLTRLGSRLMVAMANPNDIVAHDELHRLTGLEISPALSSETGILKAIEDNYRPAASADATGMLRELSEEGIKELISPQGRAQELEAVASEAPVARFVNDLVTRAVEERASDIHIEPEESSLRIRTRIDGALRTILNIPSEIAPAVVSRVKLLAGINIAEQRRPQDGQFQMTLNSRVVDFRVSSLPTIYGENLVLRILDRSRVAIRLDDLGFDTSVVQTIARLLREPHGMLLVTGPTGSGKTTTLYSALNMIDTEGLNIITVEDPVEYRLPGVRQAQVNPKSGMTFAAALRSILRQDPDVVMVGEIRDSETASIAVQAALTGHLVLSTLHTNDAAGALTRLIDMGVEPFLVASSVLAVLAQRLVRRVCSECSTRFHPPAPLLESLGLPPETSLSRGQGCRRCQASGYRGRLALGELLVVDDGIRHLVMQRAAASEIAHRAAEQGMQSLRQDGLAKAKSGLTTLEEVTRVTRSF
ncbi:MAG: GspE/PulE family protein [candidate division WOR-3 bacterium]